MKINNPEKRLKKFYGEVDRKHAGLIIERLAGKDILEVGCGYGSLTDHISNDERYDCTGVDIDDVSLEAAKRLFSDNRYMKADGESLPFDDNSFDTIILRDTLHHLYEEGDFNKALAEFERVYDHMLGFWQQEE